MKKILFPLLLIFTTLDFMSAQIKIGDHIPEFSLPNQDGEVINITDFIGNPLVIYFYPKDNTPGCTAEACTFRDAYEDFRDLGAEVIGISSDSPETHKNFAEKHRLPFILLADEENVVEDLFGVPKSMFGMLPGRVTYIINEEGIVVHTFSGQLKVKKHVKESLKALGKLDDK